MKWLESVQEIQQARDANRLVMFVGAGVSANSGLPTWKELVREFAIAIGYDKNCQSCKKRIAHCPNDDCEERFKFAPDEYLRIPEYYYNRDSSDDHSRYYTLIAHALENNGEANAIHDEVINILPRHIITTNYDSLLEDSSAVNTYLYEVVAHDRDLLSKVNDRYIIKMHGDIRDTSTLVLKESDYINYEQEHVLISTFIKSLLVNHTFVFIGYSLNDYNLNQIIGWVNYFSKVHRVPNRPKSFLVQSKAPSDFEKTRLENRGIFVVDLESLPEDLISKVQVADIDNSDGHRLLAYLRCLTDLQLLQAYSPLSMLLEEKYQSLLLYTRISHEDLACVSSFGRAEFLGMDLVLYDSDMYKKMVPLLTDKHPVILNTFQRAGITTIHCRGTQQKTELPMFADDDDLFRLYLDNDYQGLVARLTSSSPAAKIYYHRLFYFDGVCDTGFAQIEDLLAEDFCTVTKGDFVAMLLYKMRSRLSTVSLRDRQQSKVAELNMLFDTAPVQYRDSIGYLKKLLHPALGAQARMETLLREQEAKYTRNSTIFFGHSHDKIWALQAYAYDYYYFFKKNYLPLDYFTDPKIYFSYYLKAILCSYSPDLGIADAMFGLVSDRKSYPLGEIEIDMIVKYTSPKLLRQWIKEYSIRQLIVEPGVDLSGKFNRFCNAILEIKNFAWLEQLLCFVILISVVQLDDIDKRAILAAIVSVVETLPSEPPRVIEQVFESVAWLVGRVPIEGGEKDKERLIRALLVPTVCSVIEERYPGRLERLVRQLAQFVSKEITNDITARVDRLQDISEKCDNVFRWRHLIPIERYADFLVQHVRHLTYEQIFHLVVEKLMPFTDQIMNRMINIVDNYAKQKSSTPGVITYPDHLSLSIEYCLILKLFDFDVDLLRLAPYVDDSDHLSFMLRPSDFDYSKVDTNNLMWANLFFSPEYGSYLVNHKSDILTEDLESLFSSGVASVRQQKIVYGMLLEKDALRKYGQ